MPVYTVSVTIAERDASAGGAQGAAEEARALPAAQLASTRTTVVFGAGNADADLMFVGEAPGANEDRLGLPFVGQAGKLLDTLLGEIGLERGDVFICNVLKCRPPGNRDPQPTRSSPARLPAQPGRADRAELICTLGNFSTKLLRGDTTGISRLHGQLQEYLERRRLGSFHSGSTSISAVARSPKSGTSGTRKTS